jgi:aminopeptidase N
MTLRLLALLSVCGIASPSVWADTYPRQHGVDAIHYVFDLTLSDESNAITGRARVTLRFLQPGLTSAELDLVSPRGDRGMTVTSVSADGAPVPFVHRDDRLRLSLPASVRRDEELTLSIEYQGVPADGLIIGPNKHGDRTFFGLNWPDLARHWLPMVDHPYDKATGELVVTAPAHYQVVSNGVLVEEVDLPGARRRTHWKQSVPIASWLFTVGVARFAVHHAGDTEGVPLQTWVFPQDRDAGIRDFEEPSRDAMAFFAGRIGPFPYEKLANVQAAGLRGGTEMASAIMYGEDAVTGEGRIVGLVAHEIAHQWFGNAVTEQDWDDVWLSEGFATYCTLLFIEHTQGRDAFVSGLVRSRDAVFALDARMPDTAIVHRNLSDMSRVLNRLIYQKGGWTLHMLRALIGTDRFWQGLRAYYRKYRDRHATTEDFRREMEAASGLDLEWFFAQWLTRPGYPVLRGSWRYDGETKRIEIDLDQAQAGEPFRFPLDVGVASQGGKVSRLERVEVTGRRHRFSIAAGEEPESVTLDPNTWVLMDAALTRH